MSVQSLNFLTGLGTGYFYTTYKHTEDEVRQGGNHVIAAIPQASQVFILGNVISILAEKALDPSKQRLVNVLCNVVPLLSIPSCLFLGAVNNGQFSKFSEFWNRWMPSFLSLPSSIDLGERSIQVIAFFSEHLGDLIRVSMVVASVAFIALGSTLVGAGILTSMAYEVIDQRGWVPREVSLFIETYMPLIKVGSMLISGTVIMKFFTALEMLTYSETINRFIQHKMDRFARYLFSIDGASLEEIDAPLLEEREFSFEKINEILDADANRFTINATQCSKWVHTMASISEDRDFDQYTALFNQIDWTQKYDLLKLKFKDDARFIDFLKRRFLAVPEETLKANIDEYIAQLAAENNISKQQFAAHWLRDQMLELVSGIKGERRVAGLQRDLNDAIEMAAQVLFFLRSLDLEQNRVDVEDILLMIAVDGGNYCARGVKRIFGELQRRIFSRNRPATEVENPRMEYELNIKQILQDMRLGIVDSAYQTIMNETADSSLLNRASQDVHFYDMYRQHLSLGFSPLTPSERQQIGMSELMVWFALQPFRNLIYVLYQEKLHEAINQIGEVHFANYIRLAIHENLSLSEEQKNQILEKYTERNEERWSIEETQERFHRLMFVMLGILKHI